MRNSAFLALIICFVLSFTTAAFAEEERKAGAEKTIAGMKFCWCPPGSFMMGSPESEEGRDDDEGPRHRVEIKKGFWMGKYEVTNSQWEDVMDDNNSYFMGSMRPVERVSWNDCQKFVEKLNSRHNGVEFALPSEAQWEYACRAGTTTPFHFGETIAPQQVNYEGYYPCGNASKGFYITTEVGSYPSNAWGLHDMHGNVCEWCQDRWHDSYRGAPTDGTAWESGDNDRRVLRGGSWRDDAEGCRSADRDGGEPDSSNSTYGFRLVVPSPSIP